MLSTGCRAAPPREYLPASKQVFVVPEGSRISAPKGRAVVSDGPAGPESTDAIIVPYDAVLMSKGRFLELFHEALNGAGEEMR